MGSLEQLKTVTMLSPQCIHHLNTDRYIQMYKEIKPTSPKKHKQNGAKQTGLPLLSIQRVSPCVSTRSGCTVVGGAPRRAWWSTGGELSAC